MPAYHSSHDASDATTVASVSVSVRSTRRQITYEGAGNNVCDGQEEGNSCQYGLIHCQGIRECPIAPTQQRTYERDALRPTKNVWRKAAETTLLVDAIL